MILKTLKHLLKRLKYMKKFDIEALKVSLQKYDNINFSFLFGSSKEGILIRDSSDIDIAVHFSGNLNPDILADIIGSCQDAVEYDNIDLSILNKYNPILAFEALCGKILTCKDREIYETFYSLTCRYYEYEMMKIHRFFSYVKK